MSDVMSEMHALRERMRAEYDATVKHAEELRAALVMMGEQFTRRALTAAAKMPQAAKPKRPYRRAFGNGEAKIALLRELSQHSESDSRSVALAMYGNTEHRSRVAAMSTLSAACRHGLAKTARVERINDTLSRHFYAITDAGREYLATHGGE